jgi:hypothetical protein
MKIGGKNSEIVRPSGLAALEVALNHPHSQEGSAHSLRHEPPRSKVHVREVGLYPRSIRALGLLMHSPHSGRSGVDRSWG